MRRTPRRRLSGLLTVALLLISGACSSVTADADWDTNVDFSQFKTWQFLHKSPPKTGNPELDNQLFHERVQKAIRASFAEKKLREVGPGEKPDLLVTYTGGVRQKIDVDYVNNYYGYRSYHWGGWASVDRQVRVNDVGNLLLDLLLPEKDGKPRLVWRGSAEAYVQKDRTPEQKYDLILQALRKMLGYFPPPHR